MARVLVTGMSGAGKTTLLEELGRRGHVTVDTDHGGWTSPDGTWDEARMDGLLADRHDLVVSGTVEDQGRSYDRFDHVVLLSAPLRVLLDRVRRRTSNPYGSTAEQRAEITGFVLMAGPLLRGGATVELDGQRPVPELADAVERLVAPSDRPAPATGEDVGAGWAGGVDASPFFVGTATTLVRACGFTVLTDPSFLHAGERAHLGHGLTARRLTGPAIGPEDLLALDVVVLSPVHGDHWDRRSRAGLDRGVPVVAAYGSAVDAPAPADRCRRLVGGAGLAPAPRVAAAGGLEDLRPGGVGGRRGALSARGCTLWASRPAGGDPP